MKKILFFVILISCCLSVKAQLEDDTLVLIAEKNWAEATDPIDFSFIGNTGTVELVDEGLAITNPRMQDQMWDIMVFAAANFDLEEGRKYVVRLNLRVPSDGTYHVDLCSWDGSGVSAARQVYAKARKGFQIIDVEYPEYIISAKNCMVVLGCGWVVGTTIIQEVKVFEKIEDNKEPIETAIKPLKPIKADDATYNLAGQKVNTSYKGIVIQNGKKVVK